MQINNDKIKLLKEVITHRDLFLLTTKASLKKILEDMKEKKIHTVIDNSYGAFRQNTELLIYIRSHKPESLNKIAVIFYNDKVVKYLKEENYHIVLQHSTISFDLTDDQIEDFFGIVLNK